MDAETIFAYMDGIAKAATVIGGPVGEAAGVADLFIQIAQHANQKHIEIFGKPIDFSTYHPIAPVVIPPTG